jgi:hypothetical protein
MAKTTPVETPVEETQPENPVEEVVEVVEDSPVETPVEVVEPVVEQEVYHPPVLEAVIPMVTEFQMNASIVTTARLVEMDEKVGRYYPLGEGEKDGSTMRASINEFFYEVPKGRDVQVPKMFAEIFDKIRDAESGRNVLTQFLHDNQTKVIERL